MVVGISQGELQLEGRSPDVVVNTTTWGETDASEADPFGVRHRELLAPGVRFFDLNNRVGSLPLQALQAGCTVMSGALMQRVTNASRAALLSVFDTTASEP